MAIVKHGEWWKTLQPKHLRLWLHDMGRTPKRELKCNICKSNFPSFKDKSNDKFSHRSHRIKNEFCLAAQERLRREHASNGNSDEINFDYIEDEDEIETADLQ